MRIEEKFQELNDREEGAYMPHIYYGDPTEDFSMKQIEILLENGADFLEFGIPFSDPTADGPVFQSACDRALKNGITPQKCIEGIRELRRRGADVPVIVTTYYNIPYVYGIEKFFEDIEEAGADGVIVPNMPVEEIGEVERIGSDNGLDVILQVTPNTSDRRLDKIVSSASGFLYVINVEGVTGVRESIPAATRKLISKVSDRTDIPLMAGFGISKKRHARSIVSAGADGVITGSALGRIYESNLDNPENTLPEIGEFAREIKQGSVEGYRTSE